MKLLFSDTVVIRINSAAFIKCLALKMRRLFEGGVYSREAFIANLLTTTVNLLCQFNQYNQLESHWQKKERKRTSCTGKILGCYQGIAHRRSFREGAKPGTAHPGGLGALAPLPTFKPKQILINKK